ncbi:efflux RND transporter periplasmic adaptor subunit [Alteromonas sp. ASW11-36]|uniref:Efflux RND transporter periplasmic adaptor subunit n=1 Tax=Alteromonas arenosi TaxID=3055817 RepID=A0ABT7SVM0_9ALTE|nr:efflux RND transporter periplasmic adaptor subunit [Alteromonas sp. ASW11-36]MDM7860242.1 efflux RND transporter periplasmic adaptor subunit [Alteromonas sp. ASW11-36]
MKMLTSLQFALLASCSLYVGSGIAQQAPAPEAALVEVQQVLNESIADHIWLPGTVMSRTDSQIAAEVSGRLTWLADEGEIIQAGEVLAKLDDTRLQLLLGQNQVNINKLQARVDLLTRRSERFIQMAAQNATSKDQLDDINMELEMAKQDLAEAEYTLQLTQYQIAQSEVKAPFTAMVVERLQSPGEFTAVGQNLMRIVDTQNVEVSVRAPLTAIPYIQKGMIVTIDQQAARSEQPIRAIIPIGNEQSRMMEIRVSLDPTEYAIGSAVRVALPHSDFHDGLTVPRDALVLRKSGTFIYQVNADNEAFRVPVETGIGVDERIEVFGNIEDKMPVVTRGAERLREGQKVRFETDNTILTAGNSNAF